jgi:hypothetical protein
MASRSLDFPQRKKKSQKLQWAKVRTMEMEEAGRGRRRRGATRLELWASTIHKSYSPSMGVGHVDWSGTNLRTRWDENLHQKWMTKHVAHTIILFFEQILIIQLRFGVKT